MLQICFSRGHNSIAGFTLDDDRKLTALDQTSTEKTPWSFDIDPRGQFLYAVGDSSRKLTTFQIDTKAGTRKLVTTLDVGKTTWWVLAVEMRQEWITSIQAGRKRLTARKRRL
jgi:6-phosphogluconolactonase